MRKLVNFSIDRQHIVLTAFDDSEFSRIVERVESIAHQLADLGLASQFLVNREVGDDDEAEDVS